MCALFWDKHSITTFSILTIHKLMITDFFGKGQTFINKSTEFTGQWSEYWILWQRKGIDLYTFLKRYS